MSPDMVTPWQVGAIIAQKLIHCWKVAPSTVMASRLTRLAVVVLSSLHWTSKVDPVDGSVYKVLLLAGQEIPVAAGAGRVVFVGTVVFAKGAWVEMVEKVEDKPAVPAEIMVEVMLIVAVETAATDEVFSGKEMLTGGELAAVVSGMATLVEVFRGNDTMSGRELTAVVRGMAILEEVLNDRETLTETEGAAAEGL